MTRIIILGETQGVEPEKKKIEFVKCLTYSQQIEMATTKPCQFKNIELISKNYGEYDLMFAYDDNRNIGILYLGHFGDGIV